MARRFDAIVIGSGLGGLIAGALYARSGRRVLVLERNETFGGAAAVYKHGALTIEATLHEMDGLDQDDPKLPCSFLALTEILNSSMSATSTKSVDLSSIHLLCCRTVSTRRSPPPWRSSPIRARRSTNILRG